MRLHIRLSAVVVLVVTLLAPGSLLAREWTDVSGQHHREAEFLSARDGQVWLRGAGGKTYTVALDKLSDADRAYVESLESPATAKPGTGTPTLGAPAKTLSYRIPRLETTAAAPSNQGVSDAANTTFMRLTGWRHHGHHCCPTVTCCPVPCPSPCPQPCPNPCPQPEDKGKRVMKGWHSTFHLVSLDKGPDIDGTGAYQFVDAKGCCHRYLELLKVTFISTNFDLTYEVVDSTPALPVTHWKFQSILSAPHCFHVYYSVNGTDFVYYDTARAKVME